MRDWRYGPMALVDRAIADFPELRDAATRSSLQAQRGSSEREKQLRDTLNAARKDDLPPLRWLDAKDPYVVLRGQLTATLAEADELHAQLGELDKHNVADRAAVMDGIDVVAERSHELVSGLIAAHPAAAERHREATDLEYARALGPVVPEKPKGMFRRLRG